MTDSQNWLYQQLQSYKTWDAVEARNVRLAHQFLGMADSFERSCLPGHFVGAGLVLNASGTHALLQHHVGMNKWVTPGGHADGDDNLEHVTRRELEEETSLTDLSLISDGIFDFDVHYIPDSAKKDEPIHLHLAAVFLLQAAEGVTITINDESHAMEWIAIDDIATKMATDHPGVTRMIEKLRQREH